MCGKCFLLQEFLEILLLGNQLKYRIFGDWTYAYFVLNHALVKRVAKEPSNKSSRETNLRFISEANFAVFEKVVL